MSFTFGKLFISTDSSKRIDAAKDIRDLEEAEFDREIDEVEQQLLEKYLT